MKTLLFALLANMVIATSHAQITSTFDIDADGWTFLNSTTTLTPNHSAASGNPGGFISVTYPSNINTSTQSWIAPAKFRGNQLVRSLGMNLTFDLQQSLAGTHSNGNGDVRIESTSGALVYSLPTKPATAPAWSSYSLKLDETQGWRMNATNGTLATREQIKGILRSITSIEFRGTYITNASYISGVDNVTLEQRTLPTAPGITSFAPISGKAGTTLTITGNNFNPTASNNSVYFGLVRANIISASTTQITVTIPVGASFDKITVVNKVTGLSQNSLVTFNPAFDGGGRIIPASFPTRVDLLFSFDQKGFSMVDIDGDGWVDLAGASNSVDAVEIYRNLGLGGDITTTSFDTRFSINLPGSGTNGTGLSFADLDGDGLKDMISSSGTSAFSAAFITFRNISTPGNVAFDLPEIWSAASDESPIAHIADLDGDGRPELMSGEGSISSVGSTYFWADQNISTPGDIEFGPAIGFFNGSVINGFSSVTTDDLDGDGKNELIVTHGQGQDVTVLRNISTPGSPAFENTFTISTGVTSVITADVNMDGKKDLLWKAGLAGNIYIRLNTNSGGPLSQSDFASEIIITGDVSGYGGITIADINGDGKPDIVATDNTDAGVYENVYAGGAFDANAFVRAYQYAGGTANTYPTSPRAADLNGDNKPDMIFATTNTTLGRISIFENKNIHTPVISINTVAPLSGPMGSTVNITGDYFSTVPTENLVQFGAVRATVVNATQNLLTVTVPAGATMAPVSVTRNGLTSIYRLPFVPTFSSGVSFNNTHFAAPVGFPLNATGVEIDVADLNNDGKPDVVSSNSTSSAGYAFRNTHSSGAISATSLVPDDTTGSFQRLMDFDGDGLKDMLRNGSVNRNISTPTEINFGASLTSLGTFNNTSFGDLNEDGKIDIAGVNVGINFIENRTVPGAFTAASFSPVLTLAKPATGGATVSSDFDNDGLTDIAATNPTLDNVSVFRNTGAYRINVTQFASVPVITVGDNPGRMYTGDFDLDGKMDLLVIHIPTTTSQFITILHNTSTTGNISFNRVDYPIGGFAITAHISDLDGDGRPEILAASETSDQFLILKNTSSPGVLNASSFATPFSTTVINPRGITAGDLNLDGKPEIIIGAQATVWVYENLVGNPSITSFDPFSGPIGTTVTITGENFSSTPANNIVTFNGIAAVVTASTATSITTTVPAGATTGVISVTVSGVTGVSATAFTVTSPVLTPGLVWARGHIGTTDTFSEDVATDAAGNVYTTGQFDQTTDFDPGPGVLNLTSAGNADIYVSKLSASGDLAWAFSLGSITSDAGTGITTDANGNVYVTGSFSGTVDFDPGPGTTNLIGGGRFLCKFDTNGNLISAFGFPGTLSIASAIEVDAADNLYLAGSFSGTADFDPGAGLFNMTSAGSSDIFVLKLSSAGTFIWAKRMGSTLFDRANALTLDATGSAHITGSFNGTVDFDPGAGTANLTSAGASDLFIEKIDNAGNYVWARRVGGTSALDTGNGIALDGDDNVLITGSFDGTVDFDPGAGVENLTSFGGGDAYVLKLTSAGNFVWAKNMGGPFGDTGTDIVCDAFDNVYTTGDLRSNTADFDPGPATFNLSPTGSWEVYLSGLDAAGNFMWAIASQGAAGSSVYQPELSLDAAGNIILIGVIEDAPADLDPGICVTNVSPNGVAAFITKLRPGTINTCGPVITINPQPASTFACVGTSATFTTGASGTTNILFQWQYSIDGISFSDIVNNANYTGTTTSSLSISVTGLALAGFYRCKVDGDLAATVFTSNATLTVNTLPAAPIVTPGSGCAPTTVTLNASGGSAGQYRWYTAATGGTVITGEVNSSYITPVLTTTTSYFVSIDNGSCESLRTAVVATINMPPAIPTVTSSITPVGNALTICSTTSLTLSGPAGFASYNWSTGATTQQISVGATGNYSVTVTDAGGCVSPASIPVVVTVTPAPCNNQAPVITTASSSTVIGGQVTINLLNLISDADNNLVPSSLAITQQTTSGALAAISNGILEIDYQGLNFSGRDQVTIQVCDVFGECTQQSLEIDVIGEIEIYNGISPNNDDQNEIFLIRYIDLLPDTQNNKVTIFNRWGSKVFEVANYNNTTNVFRGLNNNGNELPSGTYFYMIEFISGRNSETGYLALKR